MAGKQIGQVTHFFDRIGVAVLALTDSLATGATIHILGPHTDVRQTVTSMQIEHAAVPEAGPGQDVAIKVESPVRPHDKVYLIPDED